MKRFSYNLCLIVIGGIISLVPLSSSLALTEKSGSVGLQGTISTDPPKQAAIISIPTNNQFFSTTPITVNGICQSDLLVKIYKNNVFGGSTTCTAQGTFSLLVDLFSGANELVARVHDSLNQAGPDSNVVTVRLNDTVSVPVLNRITLTSIYANRGTNPDEPLKWPFIISGGSGPYALAVDWGDQTATPFSSAFAGEIMTTHTYNKPGIYVVVIRATDSKQASAYLQTVSIVSGTPTESNEQSTTTNTKTIVRYAVWPLFFVLPLLVIVFWIATRHENRRLRALMTRGQQPFR